MRNEWRVMLPVLALTLLLAPGPVEGQERAREMNRQQMEERVQRLFEQRMARSLELSPEQRERMSEVLAGFRDARRELMPRRRGLQADVRRFLADGGDDDARARELLGRMEELRQSEARLQREEQERLMEILTPSQVLRMHTLRQEFGNRIRTLEMGTQRRRMIPGGQAWRTPPPRQGPGGGLPGRRGPRGPRGGGAGG